jgi:hypothetical protein
MKKPPNVIDFDHIIKPLNDDIKNSEIQVKEAKTEVTEDRKEIIDLIRRIQELASDIEIPIDNLAFIEEENELNKQVDDLLLIGSRFKSEKYSKFPKLSSQDTIVSVLSGAISIIIDVVFVGTPDVVKIYKGGENFDGSILTDAFRKLGKDSDGELSQIFTWLSDKCKVPYDIPLKRGVITPNNHRLRSLAHDPFFGLLFAVADIILGTTTGIDNNGNLRILVNKNKAPTSVKWLSVIYYLGHLVSDICTARGLPIPGFFLTQFFTNEIADSTLAKTAEDMYKNGYDLRHMASMSVPVLVKNMIINMYIKFTIESPEAIMTIADREKYELNIKLKTYKMMFVSNLTATTGNVVKFLAPPVCGNPCAINLVQWLALLDSSIKMYVASIRDFTVEEALVNRSDIDKMWNDLVVFSD